MQTQQTYKRHESPDIVRACRETRERIIALVRELPDDALATPVPACPGWSVRDVVGHLAGNVEDAAAGAMSGPPTAEQTAAQVARMRERSLPRILADWQSAAESQEAKASPAGMRLPLIDLTSHEHDIRGALARPEARDTEAVRLCSELLLRWWRPPVPVRVVVEDAEFRVGPGRDAEADSDTEASELVLTTSRFETLRWRMGRRSPAQLAAMRWSADPSAVLGHLAVFGPAEADVVE